MNQSYVPLQSNQNNQKEDSPNEKPLRQRVIQLIKQYPQIQKIKKNDPENAIRASKELLRMFREGVKINQSPSYAINHFLKTKYNKHSYFYHQIVNPKIALNLLINSDLVIIILNTIASVLIQYWLRKLILKEKDNQGYMLLVQLQQNKMSNVSFNNFFKITSISKINKLCLQQQKKDKSFKLSQNILYLLMEMFYPNGIKFQEAQKIKPIQRTQQFHNVLNRNRKTQNYKNNQALLILSVFKTSTYQMQRVKNYMKILLIKTQFIQLKIESNQLLGKINIAKTIIYLSILDILIQIIQLLIITPVNKYKSIMKSQKKQDILLVNQLFRKCKKKQIINIKYCEAQLKKLSIYKVKRKEQSIHSIEFNRTLIIIMVKIKDYNLTTFKTKSYDLNSSIFNYLLVLLFYTKSQYF